MIFFNQSRKMNNTNNNNEDDDIDSLTYIKEEVLEVAIAIKIYEKQ